MTSQNYVPVQTTHPGGEMMTPMAHPCANGSTTLLIGEQTASTC